MNNWENFITDYKRYSKPFQVLTYAYMMNEHSTFNKPITGGIISFKNLQEGLLKFKEGKNDQITSDVYRKFLSELKRLIIEICNPEVPFTEKEL